MLSIRNDSRDEIACRVGKGKQDVGKPVSTTRHVSYAPTSSKNWIEEKNS